MMKKKKILQSLLKLVTIVFAATILGKIFTELGFPETNIVVMYLLAVLLVARFTSGYQYGILSAVVSLICYNYFFTEPYHTLAVNDPGYLITFSIMLTTSILTSALTTKEKLLTEEANERGKESQILYVLSSKLSDAADMEAVLKIAAESISHLLQVNVGCIYVGRQSEPIYIQQSGKEQIHRRVPDVEEIRKKYMNLRNEYLEEKETYGYPVNGREHLLAVIKIDKTVNAKQLQEKKKLLHSITENVSMAMDRIEVTIERVRDRESMERERERANLLRAISHDLRTPLSGILENAGFSVEGAVNGKDGISYMIRKNADLILLDLGLPDIDGMEVLHKIREWSEVPIIIVSARDQDKEKAAALDDGADDYLTKPFSATELMARIRVALRHYYRMNHSGSEERPDDIVYVNGGLKLDNGAHIAYKDGQEVHLTPLEYQLLLLFMQNPGKVLTYHTILRKIWGEGYGEDTQVLRSVMASTRRKIERNPAKPEYIETEIGIGYRMREHEAVK